MKKDSSAGSRHHHVEHYDSRFEMMRHSWDAPLSFDNTLGEWDLSGATIPTKSSVVLVPRVANRTGQFWHKQPVTTANFEVEFEFLVDGPQRTQSQGFAFWYVYEEYAKSYPKNDEEAKSWTLHGYKQNFKGVGVFFSNFDKSNQLNPSVSVAHNPVGEGYYLLGRDVPTRDVLFLKYRNTQQTIRFKLKAGPKGVLGQVRMGPNAAWIDAFRLYNVRVQPQGYIGFSSFTGPEVPDHQGDRVTLFSFHMYNLDMTQTGEDSNVVHDTLGDMNVNHLLKDSKFENDSDETAIIRELTRMLYKHTSEAAPREQTIFKTLNRLTAEVHMLTQDVREIAAEFRVYKELTSGNDTLHNMKQEVLGLRSFFSKHVQSATSSVQGLQRTISLMQRGGSQSEQGLNEVRQLASTHTSLEEAINSQAMFSSYAVVGAVAMVCIFALMMWKKMRDMEKKHSL
ncbi:unnamed protein product [Vitrella brassicaformis CCMP3155]|uniref:L-type lectin-like domain-containing protein n=1 Tax=Vitrella brassicaformis (strain CCMP3155) TaxID=1169540 RepID=A0A0G4FXX8_VITBC|nr:unnamed protein product [Vitrella brassicaformis CCMP3155]|eukprot:CEM19991.1 unnamed protein product [Vitrella brassicaformis CCMP3155]